MYMVIKMKKTKRKFLSTYYSLPDSVLTVVLLGCEVSVIFSVAAFVMLKIADWYTDPYVALNMADTFGAAGQRVMILGLMMSIAVGLSDKVLQMRRDRK